MDWKWILAMAIRDSRKNFGRLLLYISSIIIGIASIVAISTFVINVTNDIDREAKELMGADVQFRDNNIPDSTTIRFLDSIVYPTAEEIRFSSMLQILSFNRSRFVNVVASDFRFPFYGKIETKPENIDLQYVGDNSILIDHALAVQYGLAIGDSLKLGIKKFAVAGEVIKATGQTQFSTAVAPTVYISNKELVKTGLIRFGSRLNFYRYFKTNAIEETTKLSELLIAKFGDSSAKVETFEMRKKSMGDAFENVGNFLNLIAFIALLLGCIGIAGSVDIYIKSKFSDVAVLQCLGVSSNKAFLVYFTQLILLATIGSIIGATLGSLASTAVPILLADFLPVQVHYSISLASISFGIASGISLTAIFTIEPYLKIRKVSPLSAINGFFNQIELSWVKLVTVRTAIFLFIITLARISLGNWMLAMVFAFGCLVVLLVLYSLSFGLRRLGKLLTQKGTFLWRQAFLNLYRPDNQSVLLISTIGFSTVLLTLLFFTQDMILSKASFNSAENDPNMLLFDIQTVDLNRVESKVDSLKFPIIASVPIVTMRLVSVKGKSKSVYTELEKDSMGKSGVDPKVFNREWRVSYRDTLNPNEKIMEGQWIGKYSRSTDIPVSVEAFTAKSMGLAIGDVFTMNVQGIEMKCITSSIREVNWNRIETNFTLLFPEGVLNNAPKTHVILTKANTPEASIEMQQVMITQFPMISVIDLNLIIETLTDVLNKLRFVILFMSMLSIITGFIVLISSLSQSRIQRLREFVLLRTLGASQRTISLITFYEYLILGMLSVVTGVTLGSIATFILGKYLFASTYFPSLGLILTICIPIVSCVLGVGWLNSKGIFKRSPLEILSKEN